MERPDYFYLNDISLTMLSRGYLRSGVAKEALLSSTITHLNEMLTYAESILGFDLPMMRLGVRRGWVSPSSPVWANFASGRGLPISCNGSYMEDDMDSILWTVGEVGKMTQEGAGTSIYMNPLRGMGSDIAGGGKSNGPVHFARLPQEAIQVISQSGVRRGSCCIYFDITHPDIDEILNMRANAGGVHHPIQHLDYALGIPNDWFEGALTDEKGSERRKILTKVRNVRRAKGRPFLFFPDNANAQAPQVLKDKGLRIHASNLCTEIMLPSGPDESFVCNLSSANLLYYDEWKNTNFIREMIYFLDAILTDYIDKTDPVKNPKRRFLERAWSFAKRWRALGLGTLGYHSLLKSKMIPFESQAARDLNIEVHRYMRDEADAASRYLAELLGEPEGMEGTGYRNLTRMAIAPTQSSSIICGQVSKSIEPEEAVVFENDNAKLVFTQYCPFFRDLLRSKGKDTTEVWETVMQNGGRVDHLDFLTDHEKEVFKPWMQIDPKETVQQAIDRQPFIDQGQSLNIILPPEATLKDDIDIIAMAIRGGLKSLYYRNGLNEAQQLARQNASCAACEA